jgi:hypothetical protein
MKKWFLINALLFIITVGKAQSIISGWKLNTTNNTVSYYKTTGSGMNLTYTYVNTTTLADVLKVCYSSDYVWIQSEGMTDDMGKYLNPGECKAQSYVFKFPTNPKVASTKTESPYTGAIGVLLNGVPIYGLSNSSSYTGSGMSPMGAGVWNAEVGYNEGFVLDDNFGGHPQQDGAYHSHTTPIKLYNSTPSTQHSPIVGFAFDGYPVYGPYAYSSATNSSSTITRMKSGYALRNITTRTKLPDGSTASQTGPTVNSTYPLGYFIEDYAWSSSNGGDLDEYNGRYCITPEYPNGTYAYFVTMDASGNAQFPYYIGNYYYGEPVSDNFGMSSTISMPTNCSNYTGLDFDKTAPKQYGVYPNPTDDNITIANLDFEADVMIYNSNGELLQTTSTKSASIIVDLSSYPSGIYTVKIINNFGEIFVDKISVVK